MSDDVVLPGCRLCVSLLYEDVEAWIPDAPRGGDDPRFVPTCDVVAEEGRRLASRWLDPPRWPQLQVETWPWVLQTYRARFGWTAA